MSSLSSVGSSTANNSLNGSSGNSSGTTPGTTSGSSSGSSSSSTPITGLSTSGISFSGLASGLDTNQLIQGLLAVQQQQVTNLQNQQAQLVQEETAFNTIQAKLLALQSAGSGLSGTFNSVFDARSATSSNQNLATASASSGAQPGVYSFTVNSLAQAQEMASQGFDSATSAITQGTFQFQVGSGTVNSVTVDNTNDTLQGLANSINNLNAGVTASIVNDGGSSANYHLLLTANNSGTANAITITNNLGASGGGATQPALNTIVTAANASIALGSGSNALTITNSTNQISNAFNGITLNLTGADPTQTVNVTVANDTKSAGTAVDNFVSAYNDLVTYINQNSSFDAQTGQAGLLLGNLTASNIENTIIQTATGVVGGVNKLANNLAAVGVTLNADGTLAVDDTKLNQALSGQVTGVTSADVRRLFVQDGQSTNNAVQFIFASNSIKAVNQPIQVQVTQAATQGTAAATNVLAASTTITTGSNDTFGLTVDGASSGPFTLAAGTYTPQQLAQQVQSVVNAKLTGAQITASVDSGGHLVLTSQKYGSTSKVAVASGGDALSALGFSGTEYGTGQDVAGSFLVNGVTEAANGSGQILTSNSSNKNTSSLVVRVTLTPAQITANPEGSVTVTQGIGAQTGNLLGQLLDPVSGQLATTNQSLQSQVNDLTQSITQQQNQIQQQQQSLLLEFSQMESTIAQLQAAGNALGASLTGFSSTNGSSSSSSAG